MIIKKIRLIDENGDTFAYMYPNEEKIHWHDPYGGQFSPKAQETLTWILSMGKVDQKVIVDDHTYLECYTQASTW